MCRTYTTAQQKLDAVENFRRGKEILETEAQQMQDVVTAIPHNVERAGRLYVRLSALSQLFVKLLIGEEMVVELLRQQTRYKRERATASIAGKLVDIRKQRAALAHQDGEFASIEAKLEAELASAQEFIRVQTGA